ncbi:hypothetical protein PPYR_11030 [Photinus pyralis]|uniref:Sulfhydryl oxidase n=1 Tax=Photinus pyralis TaxID=7054 RepID=A0A5N4AI46_PHOPY|nr:hypothetical protein PPYR_11030 [Photinus pyralis]
MLSGNILWISSLVVILTNGIDLSENATLTNKDLKKYKHLIEGQGLYSTEDEVTILTAFNFKNEIYNASHSSLVEFYNSWCGHCQRFAPSWKALAASLKQWKDVVVIAAIDCNDEDNSQLCRDFEIMAYPTLRYFHENYKEGAQNIGVEVEKGDDVYSQKRHLIQRIIQEQTERRGTQFPSLLPISARDVSSLRHSVPRQTKYAFVIIDTAHSVIGAELAMDLRHVPNVIVKSAGNNSELLAATGVKLLPALLIVDEKNNVKVLQEALPSTDIARNTIKEYLSSMHISIPNVTLKGELFTGKWINAKVPDMSELMEAREKENLRQRIKQMGDVVFQADLETALRYSFKLEVGSVKTISGERLTALVDYVSILAKYFPFGIAGKQFLHELKRKILEAGEVLQGSDVSAWLRDAEPEDRRVFSSPAQWLGCQGSAKNYRGYPCGLWKLFHYLTVSAAEHNWDNSEHHPREVLDAMHGYIKNFFGCSECSRHFQEMALKKDMKGVSSLDTSILWLWMAHNEVNKRLAGDTTEDPEFPKVQFPLPGRCPACRTNNTWNLQDVVGYMKQVYSSINVRYIGSDTRILHLGLEGSSTNDSTTFFLKNVDPSTCFILYVVCFFLLCLLIRLFLKRGYKKKMYVHDLLGKV